MGPVPQHHGGIPERPGAEHEGLAGWLGTHRRPGVLGRPRLPEAGDRIDHVIKNGGLKIYPATIEKTLMMHHDVSGAAVFGIRHRNDYEEAYAAITDRLGAACTLSELREHLSAALLPAQVPATIAQWAVLPTDDSGKTDKRRLRAFVEAGDCDRHGLLAEGGSRRGSNRYGT